MFDIDIIVQQVLDDLAAKPAVSAVQNTAVQNTALPEPAADGVYISGKVISLSTIREQLGTGKKLFIPPKSILTPSAKDEIKKRNIEIAVRIKSEINGENNSETNTGNDTVKQTIRQTAKQKKELWIAEIRPAAIPKNVLNRLRKAFAFDIKQSAPVGILLNEIRQKYFGSENYRETRGVVITNRAANVLQLLNRNEKIRAVSGSDAANIAEDIQETDANVIVLRLDRIAEIKIFDVIGQFFSR